MRGRTYLYVKRGIDLAVASLGLLVLSPVLALIALAIYLDSPGPVLYRGERVGLGSRLFRMLKFRTMVVNADRRGASSTPDDDPRLTRVGRFLRRFKLDELPQLFNVLRGEMSLVGPRPQVPWAVALYSPEDRMVLTVRPGMTDYASLVFHNEGEILRGADDPDRTYLERIHPHKMRLGVQYVQELSLRTDLRILRDTLLLVLGRRPNIGTRPSVGRRAPDDRGA